MGVNDKNADQKAETMGKAEYTKPHLRIIDMTAEETLAVGCKMTGGGSNFGSPTTCGVPTCAQDGS